jgi:hypothetical protein
MPDETQLLLEYIGLLEKELESADPARLAQLIDKRQSALLSLVQTQRSLIQTLRAAHQADRETIAELQVEIAALRAGSKERKVGRPNRPNTDRSGRKA